jgi:hypothetical protein
MNYLHIFRLSLPMATALLTFYLASSFPAKAGEKNGKTFFDYPPTLQRSVVRDSGANSPVIYEFTLNVPTNAGESLQAVMVSQNSNANTVDFQINRSTAFTGSVYRKEAVLPLASVGGPGLPGEAMIVFHRPVQPGQTVTIAIPAQNSPTRGLQVFKVTAYPSGQAALGQFLGYSRLNFEPQR